MFKKILPLILIVFVTSSCSLYHVTSSSTSDNYYPANEDTEVVYLETIGDSDEIIGSVIVNAERRQEMSYVLARIKREAALLGGDAITDLRSDATGAWKVLPAQQIIGNAYVRANFTANVVKQK